MKTMPVSSFTSCSQKKRSINKLDILDSICIIIFHKLRKQCSQSFNLTVLKLEHCHILTTISLERPL